MRLESFRVLNLNKMIAWGLKMRIEHIAFSVGSKEDFECLTEKMRNDGYDVISGPRTTGDGYYESCIGDIEGNQVEVTV